MQQASQVQDTPNHQEVVMQVDREIEAMQDYYSHNSNNDLYELRDATLASTQIYRWQAALEESQARARLQPVPVTQAYAPSHSFNYNLKPPDNRILQSLIHRVNLLEDSHIGLTRQLLSTRRENEELLRLFAVRTQTKFRPTLNLDLLNLRGSVSQFGERNTERMVRGMDAWGGGRGGAPGSK